MTGVSQLKRYCVDSILHKKKKKWKRVCVVRCHKGFNSCATKQVPTRTVCVTECLRFQIARDLRRYGLAASASPNRLRSRSERIMWRTSNLSLIRILPSDECFKC